MRDMSRLLLSPLVLLSAVAADAQPTRRMADARPTVAFRIDDASGGVLGQPALVRACGGGIIVLDLGLTQVIRLSRELKVLWRYGREGSGPGEFRAPMDVACDAAGRAWIVDPANSRITRLTSSGRLDTLVALEVPAQRLAVHPNGNDYWTMGTDPTSLIAARKFNARGVRRVPTPPEIAKVDPLQVEGWLASTGDGGIVVSFRWSSTLYRVDSAGHYKTPMTAPEPIQFPRSREYAVGSRGQNRMVRVDPDASEGSLQLAVADGIAYSLFGGAGPLKGRIVDRYDVVRDRYLNSIELTFAPYGLGVANGMLYVLQLDPAPAVIAYKLPTSPD